MICVFCGRDINAIGQDNVSPVSGYPFCEDCDNHLTQKDIQELQLRAEREQYEDEEDPET